MSSNEKSVLDLKKVNEINSLFEFVSPHELRRSITDLLFGYLSHVEDPELPNQKQIFDHVYMLINFLDEIAEEYKK